MTRDEVERLLERSKYNSECLKQGSDVQKFFLQQIELCELALDGLRWRKARQGATEQAYKKLQELKD